MKCAGITYKVKFNASHGANRELHFGCSSHTLQPLCVIMPTVDWLSMTFSNRASNIIIIEHNLLTSIHDGFKTNSLNGYG